MDVRSHYRPAVRMSADIPSLLLYAGAGLSLFFGGYQLFETYFLIPRFGNHLLYLLHMLRGITASLLLAGFVAWYLVRNPTIVQRFDGATVFDSNAWKSDQLRWFIRMRWIAAGFALALIVIAVPLTGILSEAQLPQLLVCWCLLVVANLLFLHTLQRGFDFDRQVIAQSVVDLMLLTGMLSASGGIENPLSIAYLFHVIIASILLPKRKALAVAAYGSAIFTLLALGELFEVLPHATILLFPHSVHMSGGHMHINHAAHDPVFVTARVLSFIAVILLTAHFTTLVTERLRESEGDLEQSARKAILEQRRLEGVLDAAGLGIAIIGCGGTIEWVNLRLSSWLGWTESMTGALCPHDHDAVPRNSCIACCAARTLACAEPSEAEIVRPVGGGHVRHFRSVISPVRDTDARVVQAVAVVEEITARKALEAEALHAGRLAVLGQLAAGIAHEIGNPLSSLQARLQLMKRRGDPEFQRTSLEVLQSQIDRIGRIVRNVSHLSQRSRDGWVTLDVHGVVAEALSLVKLDARASKIAFAERLREAPVRGVRDHLLQIVLNLLLNAIEAMPDGGTLDVATYTDEQRVKIVVSDTGAGIDEAVRGRLFQPFFTTKPEGTGLGLSICYSLVHAHDGTIEVGSQPGHGSRFTVELPAAAAVAPGGHA